MRIQDGPNQSASAETEGVTTGLQYYRQPGGCIEASIQPGDAVDILHFCTVEQAETFLAEFAEFVAYVKTKPTIYDAGADE